MPLTPLPPYPSGWYVVARSSTLPNSTVKSHRFMGRELLLFRTQSGRLTASEAFCPHMGSHIGYGGRVEGELLRCPFHGFCFNCQGQCEKTGKGNKPKTPLSLKLWPCKESHGLVFVFHDEKGRPPTWDVPALDMTGWSHLSEKIAKGLHSHPQETTENAADADHLPILHTFHSVNMIQAPVYEGPHLHTIYEATAPTLFDYLGTPLRFRMDIHAYGLGYSFVEATAYRLGITMRHFISAVPTDPGSLDFKLIMSLKEQLAPVAPWFLRLIPGAILWPLLHRFSFKEFLGQVGRDMRNWDHKCYIDSPYLREGEGVIARYRRWASQFYPQED